MGHLVISLRPWASLTLYLDFYLLFNQAAHKLDTIHYLRKCSSSWCKKKIYLMIAYSVLCWVLSWFTTCMDLKCKMHLLWVWVLIEKTWNPGSFAFKATCCPFVTLCQCLKILKKSHFVNKCLLWILAFSTNFCPIKTDLSGISVWPQALGFQMDHFWQSFSVIFKHRAACILILYPNTFF